jgi:hypothetical protein
VKAIVSTRWLRPGFVDVGVETCPGMTALLPTLRFTEAKELRDALTRFLDNPEYELEDEVT